MSINSADPRVAKSLESLTGTKALLEDIINSPAKFLEDGQLANALRSQSGLFNLSIADRNIRPCALNTAKNLAPAVFPGGFAAADELRKRALTALTRPPALQSSGGKQTKQTMAEKISVQAETISIMTDDLTIMTKIVVEAIRHARLFAQTADDATQARCEKGIQELLAYMSMVRSPIRGADAEKAIPS